MLDKLEQMLRATGIPFAHYGWDKAPGGSYGVWAEDSAGHLYADDSVENQSIQGTVDLFWVNDKKDGFELVQEALKRSDVAWYLASIQYESDTRLVHYEWVFEVA